MTIASDQRPAASTISCRRSRSSRSRPDQETKAGRQLKHPDESFVFSAIGVVEPAIGGLRPARGFKDAGGKRPDIACEPLARAGGHQIKARARSARSRIHNEDEAANAALAVLLGQAGDLGIDRLSDLLGDQPTRIPGEIDEQESGEQREDGQIDQRQLERRRAQKLAQRRHPSPVHVILRAQAMTGHLLSRITYPAPRTVCSKAWVKPLSIFDRSREMCTSMTLVCGSKW